MTTPFTKAAVLEILRTPAASDTFPDMIRRVEALEGCGVRVKALEWEQSLKGRWIGTPPVKLSDLAFWVFLRSDGYIRHVTGKGTIVYASIAAAKAAAQADYEARILAALEPVAHPETGPGELLPCPFCGGTDMYWPHGTDPAIIECGGKHGCGARSGVPEDQTEAEAIAAWNRRAAREPGTEPTPGQFTTMCLAIEDVVTGRVFDVDPWQPIETEPKDGLIDIWLGEGRRWCDCYYDRICDEWRTSRPSGRLVSIKSKHVTHWMPRPEPPGETTSAIPEEFTSLLLGFDTAAGIIRTIAPEDAIAEVAKLRAEIAALGEFVKWACNAPSLHEVQQKAYQLLENKSD